MNEKHMESLTKFATMLTKLFEIGYSIGAVAMTVGLVLFLVDRDLFHNALVLPGEEISVHGFSIALANPDSTINGTALIIFLLAGAMILELMAWVFRNVNLILRTTQGLTKFSQGKTPFQKDNVRMMREIGIFFFSITVVELAFSGLAVLLLGSETAEVSADLGGIVMGVLMLCLSQCFALGMQMQSDVDGLV